MQVEHLESRIVALESALEARGVEVHCVSRAAQEEAVFVGRICCDTGEVQRLSRRVVVANGPGCRWGATQCSAGVAASDLPLLGLLSSARCSSG